MAKPTGMPTPEKFQQNRSYYNRRVLHMIVHTNRKLNKLHRWNNPFVSRKTKKELLEVMHHTPNCVQYVATVTCHIIRNRPFLNMNYETATMCLDNILGCTGYCFDDQKSDLKELLASLKDSEYCFSILYGWLLERVKRIDGKPEHQIY